MLRLFAYIKKTLSVRISLMVVSAMAILLMTSLAVMLHYSRKAVKEEALHTAAQTLDGAVQHIDNILLSVEQTTGNIYFGLPGHFDQPEMMLTYCNELWKNNPYIDGCAIALKPNYYKDHEYFMAYVHNDSTGISHRSYADQKWYSDPMASMLPKWMKADSLITFCLPIPGEDGSPVGVIGVDVSLSLLSKIVLAVKPSANSYCMLLAADGTFIVHPDSSWLFSQSVFQQNSKDADPTVKEAAKSMVKGETDYRLIRIDGANYFVFYKPFQRIFVPGRSYEELGWSAGIIYPEDDIFGDYNSLLNYVLLIAIAGLLLLFVLSSIIIHRQLKPLMMLTESAQRIAQGNYSDPIPMTHHHDEIGRLQGNFQQMQQSLASHIGELEQLTAKLQKHGDELREAYDQAQKADRMKTAFLHNMTNQMVEPADAIRKDVAALNTFGNDADAQEMNRLTDNIQQNGSTITGLLNDLLLLSDEEKKKKGGPA